MKGEGKERGGLGDGGKGEGRGKLNHEELDYTRVEHEN